MLGLVGKKIGMSRIYDSKGTVIPVTLIQLYECCVSDVNAMEDKDYNNVVLSYDKPKNPEKKMTKSILGIYKKKNLEPYSKMTTVRMSKDKTFNIGDISGWDVSKVSIFSAAVTVNGNSLSGIDGMFAWAGENATTFYIGDISKWKTTSATIMDCMFWRTGLNATYTLNLSSWDVSKVTSHLYFNERVRSKVTAPTWVS